MTNEEKSKRIANDLADCAKGEMNKLYISTAAYAAAMKMAQWKDGQFYKFLLWLDDYFVIKRFTDGEPMTYGDLVDNFENKSYERDTTKTD